MLWEDEEEAVNYILKNTPPSQKALLKTALEENENKLYNDLLSLVENTKTRKEFFFETEKILGYSDTEYLSNTINYKSNYSKLEELSKGQIQALTDQQYIDLLLYYLKGIANGAVEEKLLIPLIIYCNSQQQIILKNQLFENNLENLINLKKTLR